jgi:hypothetical protein
MRATLIRVEKIDQLKTLFGAINLDEKNMAVLKKAIERRKGCQDRGPNADRPTEVFDEGGLWPHPSHGAGVDRGGVVGLQPKHSKNRRHLSFAGGSGGRCRYPNRRS